MYNLNMANTMKYKNMYGMCITGTEVRNKGIVE